MNRVETGNRGVQDEKEERLARERAGRERGSAETQGKRSPSLRSDLRPDDHDLGGLDEGGGGVAFLEGELARGVSGDDRRDALVADGEDDLREEAFDLDLRDSAEKLVSAADARVKQPATRGGIC